MLTALHEAVLFEDDTDLMASTVPFIRDGIAAGDAVVVSLLPDQVSRLRTELGPTSVTYLESGDRYAHPAGTIKAYHELFGDLRAKGAGRIRVIGTLPPAQLGPAWPWWARYESTVNHTFAGYPVWLRCAYDLRHTSGAVVDDVRCTHPRMADGKENKEFVDPETFLSRWRVPLPALTGGRPDVDLTDPDPAEARHAVASAPHDGVDRGQVEDLLLAVSEMATNALRHGVAPTRLRVWTAPRQTVVTISDHGPGPSDPYAGLLPVTHFRPGGRGLWLTHQLCGFVAWERDVHGFTVCLVGGELR